MPQLVTLTDVKAYIGETTTNNDSTLNLYINAASAAADYWFGQQDQITVTNEIHDGGFETILCYNTPIISVQSLIEYVGITPYTLTLQPPGSTVNNYGYSIDMPEVGLITRRSGAGTPMPFLGGPRMVVISYTAGRATVPADVYLAILEDIRALWMQTQQGGRPNWGGAAEEGWSPNGTTFHMFPRLAAIGASAQRIPGVA